MCKHNPYQHKSTHLHRLLFVMVLLGGFLLPTADSWASNRPSQTKVLETVDFNAPNSDTAVNTDETLRGLLLEKPLLGILGIWQIQTDANTTINVSVDSGTLLQGDLEVGSWVRVESQLTLLGIHVALSIVPDQYNPGQVVMRLADGVLPAVVALRYGLTLQGILALLGIDGIYVGLTPTLDADILQLVQQLNNDPDIVWAEPVYVYGMPEGYPYKTWRWGGVDPTAYNNQMAFQQVNLDPAVDYYQGDGVVIAILDTGMDLQHPAFVGDLVAGWDFVANDADPQDEGPGFGWGHGTHVAGIAAKIAPNGKLMPVRVLDPDGRGDTVILANAIEWATLQEADVINMSLGTDFPSELLREVTIHALEEDIVVVAAAGNNADTAVQYPAGFDGVLGVTAVDAANQKAEFANYGAGWIDLAAPGIGITSTMIGPEGSGYASWSGTSMATAFVSGAAALTRQKSPMSATDVIAQLLQTNAADLNAVNAAYVNQLGGLLDIGAAVAPAPTATSTATVVEPTATPSPNVTPTPRLEQTPISTASPTALPNTTPTPPDTSQTPVATATSTRAASENQNYIYLPLVEK